MKREDIKVRGNKVFVGGRHIATLSGRREWWRGQVVSCNFHITFTAGYTVRLEGYCYRADVVKYLPHILTENMTCEC